MEFDPVANPVSRSLADFAKGPIRERLLSSINLMDNYNRGRLAEALVAELLGAAMVGEGYGDWDLDYDGFRVEVKAAGDIQSWPQQRRSPISFGIARTKGYVIQADGSYFTDEVRKRRSDVYVFCHHVGVEPGDPADWMFYVAATRTLDHVCGDQKTITLASLKRRIEPVDAGANELRDAIDSVLVRLRSK